MIIELINKVSFKRGSSIGLILFGTVLAPYMFLFQFANGLYDKTGLVPLLMISFCIGFPIAGTLSLLSIVDQQVFDTTDRQELIESRFSTFGMYSLLTGILMYVPCALKFFYPKTTQREAIILLGFAYVPIAFNLILSILNGSMAKLKKKLEALPGNKADAKNEQP